MNKVQIFVIPALEVITNIFTKVERYANQDKIPVPEDVERFFYLRSSIVSYMIFNDAFGRTYIDGPEELLDNLKELEEMHITRFGKSINIYKYIRGVKPEPVCA